MIRKLVSMFYDYADPEPCKKCLVKAKCLNAPLFNRPKCDIKFDWMMRKNIVMNRLYKIESLGAVLVIAFIAAMIVLTFGLGLWKWYDIGVEFYVKFF